MLVQLKVEEYNSPFFEDFLHSLRERKLRYYASELQQVLALPRFNQLEEALRRAMNACRSQRLVLQEHFKPIYRCQESGVVKDWKLSPLAWCLVMVNADPANPEVARMQLAMIRKSLLEH